MDAHRHLTVLRTCHYRTCSVCEGAGELVVNDTNPHGYGPDPQCDEFAPCTNPDCEDGSVVVWTDPLLVLKQERRYRRYGGAPYQRVRLRAMRSCSGLAQADMLAMAQRCVNTIERGVALLRRAA